MTKKKTKKKKGPDLDLLDPNETLRRTYACSVLGRALASIGAKLTGREKHYNELVFLLMNANRSPSDRLPIEAEIERDSIPKKYSPTEAIKWFKNTHPKWADPLAKRLEDTYNKPTTNLTYGPRGNRDLPDEFYIQMLVDEAGIPKREARVLYQRVILPFLERQEEESFLVRVNMTSKDK